MFIQRAWAEIDTSALLHNYKVIKENFSSAVMAVVKADAYGHDVALVVPYLEKAGVDAYAVSNTEEALELRNLGVKKPVLILGYTPCEAFEVLAEYDISQTVYDLHTAIALSDTAQKCGKNINIHLKLDTGMSRLGFDCRNDELCGIDDILAVLKLRGLNFEGAFTHFAVSDGETDEDKEFTKAQYIRFSKVLDILDENGYQPKLRHCNNSAGILNYDFESDICRAGIVLYGLDPSGALKAKNLKPVMSVKSVVSFVKNIKKGDSVSYGRTFTAQNDMKVATISAGYADGYPRLLSGCGEVVINGKRAKIIGRVCMDQFVVDATDIDVKTGDEVLLFGKDLPVEEVASLAGTINYEIVCGISKRVPRIPK